MRRRDSSILGPRIDSLRKPARSQMHIEAYAANRELIRERASWDTVLELYYDDRLKEAVEMMEALGTGESAQWLSWVRLIEAEHVSIQGSKVERIADWLEFEYLPDEAGDVIEQFKPLILPACDRVATLLGWEHGAPTLIAILSEAADAPWATNPHGYCMDKYPYEKICLPAYLLDDPLEFSEAVAHEYAHVATLNLTQGRAPDWLEEAVAMRFESQPDEEFLDEFVSGALRWLSPMALDRAFASDEDGEEATLRAYEQARCVGHCLGELGGASSERDPRLGALLRELGRDSIWLSIKEWLWPSVRIESALKRVYGKGSREVFARSLARLREGAYRV